MKDHNQKFLKKLDIFLLIILPIVAVFISLWFRTNYLATTLLFFGLPSIWFSYRTPHKIIRALIFATLSDLLLFFVLDYVITLNNGWFDTTIFSNRLFGILPYEDALWGFLQVFLIVILYEHFLDKGKHHLTSPHIKYFIWFLGIILSVFFVLLYFQPALLGIRYAYFWVMLVFCILPLVSFLAKFPKLISKFIKVGCYFLLLHIMFEFTALELGNWFFMGKDYVKLFNIAGFPIPLEEIVTWWILMAVGVLSWYEFFDDDRK